MDVKELQDQNKKLTKLADSMQKLINDLKKYGEVDSIAKNNIQWLRNQVKENLAAISIIRDESNIYR